MSKKNLTKCLDHHDSVFKQPRMKGKDIFSSPGNMDSENALLIILASMFIDKKINKLGLSSAKLRAQLASPARSIHLSTSFHL